MIKKTPIVYLAGGMQSNWQDEVKAKVKGCIFIDPRDHGLGDENEYTSWDLTGVDIADIIFVYAEIDNPSCIGLAVEVGWAAKSGKTIIYVEPANHPKKGSLGMVRALSDNISMSILAGAIALQVTIDRKKDQS